MIVDPAEHRDLGAPAILTAAPACCGRALSKPDRSPRGTGAARLREGLRGAVGGKTTSLAYQEAPAVSKLTANIRNLTINLSANFI
jgi:hypothetical protein